MICRCFAAAIVIGAMSQTAMGVSNAEQTPHEKAIKTFEQAFVGEWGPKDATEGMRVTLTKDRSTFIIQHENATRFAGWDPENKCIKVSTYHSNGGYGYSLWRLVDSKPTYRIELVEISPDGTRSPSKATTTVLGEDHWQYTPDGGQPIDTYRIKQ